MYNAVYRAITHLGALVTIIQVIELSIVNLVNKFTFQTLLLKRAGVKFAVNVAPAPGFEPGTCRMGGGLPDH